MNNKYMQLAIKEAEKASKKENIPVGAIIVKDNKIISKAYNKKNKSNIAIDHAEIIAIKKACRKINSWYLDKCEMYVTLEPCEMCYGAIKESRIKTIYYLLESKYRQKTTFKKKKILDKELNLKYTTIINTFFKKIR